MFRCALRRSPSSLLANDCITAMAEGLSSSFYSHFVSLLWKDGHSGYLSEADNGVNTEWDSFCSIIMQMCKPCIGTQKHSTSTVQSSWEFLISSKFHKNFCKHNFVTGVPSTTSDAQEIDSFGSNLRGTKELEKSFYSELMRESLGCLHAVYESLKLDTLRKRCALLLFHSVLYFSFCNIFNYFFLTLLSNIQWFMLGNLVNVSFLVTRIKWHSAY